MTQITKTINDFDYYLDDLNCIDCLHNKQKGKICGNGCLELTCRMPTSAMKQ